MSDVLISLLADYFRLQKELEAATKADSEHRDAAFRARDKLSDAQHRLRKQIAAMGVREVIVPAPDEPGYFYGISGRVEGDMIYKFYDASRETLP